MLDGVTVNSSRVTSAAAVAGTTARISNDSVRRLISFTLRSRPPRCAGSLVSRTNPTCGRPATQVDRQRGTLSPEWHRPLVHGVGRYGRPRGGPGEPSRTPSAAVPRGRLLPEPWWRLRCPRRRGRERNRRRARASRRADNYWYVTGTSSTTATIAAGGTVTFTQPAGEQPAQRPVLEPRPELVRNPAARESRRRRPGAPSAASTPRAPTRSSAPSTTGWAGTVPGPRAGHAHHPAAHNRSRRDVLRRRPAGRLARDNRAFGQGRSPPARHDPARLRHRGGRREDRRHCARLEPPLAPARPKRVKKGVRRVAAEAGARTGPRTASP